jgi:hypothetical protein
VLTYWFLLWIGVVFRLIMHEQSNVLQALTEGPRADIDARLNRSIRLGRNVAYVQWLGIALTAFFAAVKPYLPRSVGHTSRPQFMQKGFRAPAGLGAPG